jgi:hypothetical protein
MHPLERYLRAIREIQDSGAGVAETSYHRAVPALVDESYAAAKGSAWGWSAAPEGSKPADTGGA